MNALPAFVEFPDPDVYLRNNYVVLDFETTNREHGTALDDGNALVLACWRVGREHRAFAHGGPGTRHAKWGDEFTQGELLAGIGSADFIVAHNTKFELQWLKRCGVDLRTVLPYDTMIGEKVLAGNRRIALSLDDTAKRRKMGHKDHLASLLIKAGVSCEHIPERILDSYCHQDVALTERIFLAQRAELHEQNLLPVAYCRNIVTPVLADTEFNGMQLDRERVDVVYAEYSEKYGRLEEEFSKMTGGINVKSGKQLATYIYDVLRFDELTDHKGRLLRTPKSTRFPEGQRKTDKLTLPLLKASTKEQRAFIKLTSELVKLKTPLQNLNKMHEICEANPENPLVQASYNQTVTQTDRLSSTGRGDGGFQFHNFDRAFKRLFKARRRGWKMVEGDAPQLEFRSAAYLGNDPVAKRDIQEGVDVHAITASTLGTDRQAAKPFTFKPLYGGNSGTPRQRKYFEYFRTRYERIYRTQESWTMRVARDKFFVTPWGLKFYWPDTSIQSSGYVTNTTQIFNYPIQSLATADIIPLTLVLVWHRIAELGEDCLLVNTVHDSIISEVRDEIVPAYKQILVDCFTRDIYPMLERLYGMKFDVPLGVGIKSATHWGDTKDEEKFEPINFPLAA